MATANYPEDRWVPRELRGRSRELEMLAMREGTIYRDISGAMRHAGELA